MTHPGNKRQHFVGTGFSLTMWGGVGRRVHPVHKEDTWKKGRKLVPLDPNRAHLCSRFCVTLAPSIGKPQEKIVVIPPSSKLGTHTKEGEDTFTAAAEPQVNHPFISDAHPQQGETHHDRNLLSNSAHTKPLPSHAHGRDGVGFAKILVRSYRHCAIQHHATNVSLSIQDEHLLLAM